jgi:hypothetical protein
MEVVFLGKKCQAKTIVEMTDKDFKNLWFGGRR